VLGDADGLLSLLHQLFLLLLDLGGKVLLTRVKLIEVPLSLFILLGRFLDVVGVPLELLIQHGVFVCFLLDHRPQFIDLGLLVHSEGCCLLLLLVLELDGLGRKRVVAVVDDLLVFLDRFELLVHHAQLVLVIGLLLLSFLKLERFSRKSLLKRADFLRKLAFILHILDASLVKHVKLLLVELELLGRDLTILLQRDENVESL